MFGVMVKGGQKGRRAVEAYSLRQTHRERTTGGQSEVATNTVVVMYCIQKLFGGTATNQAFPECGMHDFAGSGVVQMTCSRHGPCHSENPWPEHPLVYDTNENEPVPCKSVPQCCSPGAGQFNFLGVPMGIQPWVIQGCIAVRLFTKKSSPKQKHSNHRH